jgi:hypothetical protein
MSWTCIGIRISLRISRRMKRRKTFIDDGWDFIFGFVVLFVTWIFFNDDVQRDF